MYKTKASLVLASGSPRRRDLLSALGLSCTIIPSGVEEILVGNPAPESCTQDWALQKAQAVADRLGHEADHWYLAVDTVVVADEEILGKPATREEAVSHLTKLSGKWHTVVSGYCLLHPPSGRKLLNAVRSQVKIKKLEEKEILAYIGTEEPFDKAGGYAVQGIGAYMVEQIQGSYTNVVGLPMTELIDDLKRLDIIELYAG